MNRKNYKASLPYSETKKMNKKLFLIFGIVFLFSFISATLPPVKTNECITIKTILNSSEVNISTISYPNSTIIQLNTPLTKIGQTFYYEFCNTTELGTYIYDYYDNEGNVYVNDFEVTSTGYNENNFNAIWFIPIILIVLFFLIGNSFKDKWKIKYSFYLFSLLSLTVFINMSKFIYGFSEKFNNSIDTILILSIIVDIFMFLYLMVHVTIEVFQYFKKRNRRGWTVSNDA